MERLEGVNSGVQTPDAIAYDMILVAAYNQRRQKTVSPVNVLQVRPQGHAIDFVGIAGSIPATPTTGYINPAGARGPQIISSCAFHTFGRCGRSRCQGRGSK